MIGFEVPEPLKIKRNVREKDVEAYLCKRIKGIGGYAYKFTSPSQRAVTDRICVLPPGRLVGVVFVEAKRPGQTATVAQMREHEKLRALGQRVEVVDSFESVDRLMETL